LKKVWLPATNIDGARFVAERLRAATEAAVFEPGTIDLKLTISVGVATCPPTPLNS
jgi:GGDEF domain-containing protein